MQQFPASDTPQVYHISLLYKRVVGDGTFPNLWMSFPCADVIAFPIQFYHLPVSFSNSTINSYAAAAATFCQAKIAERPQRWMQNLVEPQLLGTFGGEDSGLGGPGFY